jgi:hypothetical protein
MAKQKYTFEGVEYYPGLVIPVPSNLLPVLRFLDKKGLTWYPVSLKEVYIYDYEKPPPEAVTHYKNMERLARLNINAMCYPEQTTPETELERKHLREITFIDYHSFGNENNPFSNL